MGKVGAYVALRDMRRKHGLHNDLGADTSGRTRPCRIACHRVWKDFCVSIVGSALFAVILLGLWAYPVRVEAQQSAAALQAKATPEPTRVNRTKTSKTELANRFREIKFQYDSVKSAIARFAPLKPDAPSELRVTRLKIEAAMRSYEYSEFVTQKQRDQLNLLTELNDADSVRLQVAMDRLSKMQAMISNLVKKMNETGDAMAQNMKQPSR